MSDKVFSLQAMQEVVAKCEDLLELAQELREAGREMRTWIMNNTDAINSPTFILDRADIALAHASAILDAQEEKDAEDVKG